MEKVIDSPAKMAHAVKKALGFKHVPTYGKSAWMSRTIYVGRQIENSFYIGNLSDHLQVKLVESGFTGVARINPPNWSGESVSVSIYWSAPK